MDILEQLQRENILLKLHLDKNHDVITLYGEKEMLQDIGDYQKKSEVPITAERDM